MQHPTIKITSTLDGHTHEIDQNSITKAYICGPTPYTDTHAGHARTYLTFDMLRRIFVDYFKLPFQLMMNVTNIDNKIILSTYQQKYPEMRIETMNDLNQLTADQYLSKEDFIAHASMWTQRFFAVNDQLNIQRPHIVSLVTDYMNEIFESVELIEKNGFTFTHDGSVYFHGTLYESGESHAFPDHEKNFALLKHAKPFEPGWDSKWGVVRPGWHIECTAMARSVLGKRITIHSGGEDLRFPHHCNEVLQENAIDYPHLAPGIKLTCAFNAELSANVENASPDDHWIDCFMHTGHLHIQGQKMARSLKNFTTVNEMLKQYSANQLRMWIATHSWHGRVEFSEESLRHAVETLAEIENYFKQTRSVLFRDDVTHFVKYQAADIEQLRVIDEMKLSVDRSLRDNLSTPQVIDTLREMIASMYRYYQQKDLPHALIESTMNYVESILTMLGFTFSAQSNKQELLQIIQKMRREIRTIAADTQRLIKPTDPNLAKTISQSLYRLTDSVRDSWLRDVGIELVDE